MLVYVTCAEKVNAFAGKIGEPPPLHVHVICSTSSMNQIGTQPCFRPPSVKFSSLDRPARGVREEGLHTWARARDQACRFNDLVSRISVLFELLVQIWNCGPPTHRDHHILCGIVAKWNNHPHLHRSRIEGLFESLSQIHKMGCDYGPKIHNHADSVAYHLSLLVSALADDFRWATRVAAVAAVAARAAAEDASRFPSSCHSVEWFASSPADWLPASH